MKGGGQMQKRGGAGGWGAGGWGARGKGETINIVRVSVKASPAEGRDAPHEIEEGLGFRGLGF